MKGVLEKFLQYKKQSKVCKNYKVTGVTFQGRQEIISQLYKIMHETEESMQCHLVLQTDNEYDKNAISVNVFFNDVFYKIGYISRKENYNLRRQIQKVDKTFITRIYYMSEMDLYGVMVSVYFDQEE